MKKRLLSAALALAMVLTMLPLSVMPAFATDATKLTSDNVWSDSEGKLKKSITVQYKTAGFVFEAANNNNGNTATTAPNDGWFFWGKLDSADTSNTLYEAKDGVINGTGTSGTWYPDVKKALSSGVSSMKLIANTDTCDVADAKGSSLTIDLDGHTLTLSGELTQENTTTNKDRNTKLTSLSITNSKKATPDKWPVVSGRITATSQNFSYSAKNTGSAVGTKGPDITVENDNKKNVTTARTLSVTLTDAVVGNLEVSGGAANIKVTASTKGGAGTGTIKVNEPTTDLKNINYGTTTINVSGGEVGDITLNGKTGTGTSGIYLSDMAEAGAITLCGGKASDSNAGAEKQPAWGGSSTVTVGSQCVTGKISVAPGNVGAVTVNVTGGSGSTKGVDEIDLSTTGAGTTTAHTVTVDGGKVGAIKLNAGKLDIKNGADTGIVTLGAGGKTTATISGDKTKVKKVDASASKDITLNISGGTISDESAAVSLPDGYAKHTITGGSFGSSITEAGWLGSVNYEIKANELYTYTSSFQACVDAYKATPKPEITVVGATTSPFEISFILDAPANATNPAPVVVIKTDASHGITLPDKINNKPITTWYIGDDNEPKNAGALMSFAKATQVKATTSSADNSEIVSVKVADDDSNGGLSATLAGNTIQVSGALPAGSNGFVPINLKVKTAIGKEYDVTVSYAVTEKKLVAGSQSAPFAAGTDNASIQIVGTSLIYPLDGSKIVVSAGSIGKVDFEKGTAVGTVSVSLGTAEKAALKAQLDGITANFNKSTGVQEAVNKVIAGLSQTQVDNYIRQGRIAAWKADPGNTGNPNEDQINSQSAYNTLSVVVYLDVRATAWNKTVGQQSMTLNITPYYRLEVVKKVMDASDKAYTVKTGSQLSMAGLTSEYGDVEIDVSELVGSGRSMAEADWAHHGDYVYKLDDDNKFVTSHGFSPFVLNMVDPAAAVYPDSTKVDADVLGYYDDVQTAIDDTEEGNVVKLYTKYDKTAETYNFSGKARTITFDPGINGTFTPTFSGANVTADKTNGNVWTVQLNEDTAPVNTKVSVSSSGNGSASVNVSSAKPGSTVSGTYKANSGYKAGTFTATAQPGNKSVTVSVSANGTFSFTVPSDATSVTVTPSFVLDTGLPFTDVYATDWYFDGVKYCYNTTNNGYRLMEGFSDTKFGPNSAYTRAEVVTILWNMKGCPTPGAATQNYTDVAGHWGYNAIVWATNNGYAKGYPDGTFRPNQSVTREEMVVFLWRAAGKPAGYNSISLNGYTDGWNVHDWGLSAVKWAVALNILSGQNSVSLNGTLAARSTAYRREVAVTVMRFDQRNLF